MNEQTKVTAEDIRDELIDGICNDKCSLYAGDYECPNHECLVWKTLGWLDYERFEVKK